MPFGLDDDPPRRTRPAIRGVVPGIGPDDKVVLWGGGIYNWFDPLTLVARHRQAAPAAARSPPVLHGPHPPQPQRARDADGVRDAEAAEELGLTNEHVFFNEGWVDYDDRQNYLLDADVGVSTHLDHVETAFSFRTRILDYLWASLPTVATAGDSFAESHRGAQARLGGAPRGCR